MTPPFLIRVRRLFTAVDDMLVSDGVVRVEGGTITAVGTASEFGAAASSLDVVDGTLLPGFVDTHAHVTHDNFHGTNPEQPGLNPASAALTAVAQLRRHLASGVTSVLDCGAVGTTAFAIRRAVETGLIEGPRLRVVGRPITHSRGHLYMFGSVADGPDAVRREVRILSSEGADMIKFVASGGSTGGNPARASYTLAEATAAAETAHDLGLRVTTHCRAAASIVTCVNAEIDVIGHLEFLRPGPMKDFGGGAPTAIPQYDAPIGEKLAKSSALLDFHPHSSGWDTVLRLRRRASEQALSNSERAQLASLETYFEAMFDVVRRLASLGTTDRISFGSDAGGFDTEFGHPNYNVVLARLCGLTPAQSIQAVTRNAAVTIGMETSVGTIQPGKLADLVLVDGDPLQDADVLAAPRWVMKNGSVVAGTMIAPGAVSGDKWSVR